MDLVNLEPTKEERSVVEILTNLGYKLRPDNNGWRSNCVYRGGDNNTALKVFKNGNWIDFVEEKSGNLEELIQLTLDLKTIDEAKDYLQGKNYQPTISYHTKINISPAMKVFNEDDLNLFPPSNYWYKRGISPATLHIFQNGESNQGRLKGRSVFPVRNSKNEIIGLIGRSLNNEDPKYKILGPKKSFVYPAFLNRELIEQNSEVILVEGVGCCLSLWEADLFCSLVLFGLDCSVDIINFLLRSDVKRIIIATNNEKSGRGYDAAQKIYNKLRRYFDSYNVKIRLPYKKDFNEMLMEDGVDSIKRWYRET